MYSFLGVEGTHLFEDILALTKCVLSEFVNLIGGTTLLIFLFMIVAFMVAFLNVRRYVLKGDLVLMIVKDVVAGKADQPLLGFFLVVLELFSVLDLVNDSVINLFEIEEFAVVPLRIHNHLPLLSCECLVERDLFSLQRAKGIDAHFVLLSQISCPADFSDKS